MQLKDKGVIIMSTEGGMAWQGFLSLGLILFSWFGTSYFIFSFINSVFVYIYFFLYSFLCCWWAFDTYGNYRWLE